MAEPKAVPPDQIMEIAGGSMGSKHRFAAGAIDLFGALADGPRTLEELARRTHVPPRTVRISADAMVALGLVEKHVDRYRNGPAAEAYLAGKSPTDLRPFLKFWDRISYPRWMDLESCIRAAKAVELDRPRSEEEARIFSEGVAAATAGSARALLAAYDWTRHRRLLDLGGGTGSFLTTLLGAHPDLRGTLVELAATAAVARRSLRGHAVADRITILEGSFLELALPLGHDAVLLSNVVHVLSPEHNRELFHRIRAAVAPGSRLLIVDFWLDPDRTSPLFGALMSGEFLVLTGEGESYSAQEARDWLAATGWKALEQSPLAGPASLLVAEAV
ncbi:MAG: acetylserotonin O-methyltransferase [Thermoplasmata archaeon]|nr:acetylserotonin O-methyltransferase [Thermoplasmata archaeon]